MKIEYDFSKTVRGKFYRKGAKLRLPIISTPRYKSNWSAWLISMAQRVGEMVNQLARK